MTKNQIDFAALKENKRHNAATEEQLAKELAENRRHSQVVEGETSRHNWAQESEANRHNVITENEQTRTNRANEWIRQEQYEEDVRSNLAQERLKSEAQAETATHNRNTEWVQEAEFREDWRHNLQVEDETQRHNEATENYQFISTFSEKDLKDAQTAYYKSQIGEKTTKSEMAEKYGEANQWLDMLGKGAEILNYPITWFRNARQDAIKSISNLLPLLQGGK